MSFAERRLSVIISTFERPDALRLVLEGYARSAFRDFEVIVADDGSADGTGALIDELARGSPFPLARVWHPKVGFRLAAVRNLAARAAKGAIFLFTDGDCVPLEGALEPHARRCGPGRPVTGERCILTQEETQSVLSGERSIADVEALARSRESPRLRRQRFKNRFYRFTRWKPRPKLLAANASVHRADFERINGFDEKFLGWGYEDEDLARRLRRIGARILDATMDSLMLHLFHPVHDSHRPDARGSANYRYFKSGQFLTRPCQGLGPRRVEDLTLELLGKVPGSLAGARMAEGRDAPEVSVVFGAAGFFGPRAHGEIVLHVSAEESPGSLDALYQLLARKLKPSGPNLQDPPSGSPIKPS